MRIEKIYSDVLFDFGFHREAFYRVETDGNLYVYLSTLPDSVS